MVLFKGTRSESHAFLDGLLPPPDQDYAALPDADREAFEAGLLLRGQYPLAECRVVSEPGTGNILYIVHVGGPDGQ